MVRQETNSPIFADETPTKNLAKTIQYFTLFSTISRHEYMALAKQKIIIDTINGVRIDDALFAHHPKIGENIN